MRNALISAAVALVAAIVAFDSQLGVSGDNCEFIVLARSLWSGQGLSYINMPEPVVSVKFPPGFILMLAPLSSSIMAMKILVVGLFVCTASLLGWKFGIWAGLATALNPLLLLYSSQIMSEIPYTALSVGALILLPHHFALGLLLASYASLTRSVGLVLLIAIAMAEKGRRRWWAATAAVVTYGGWAIRGKLSGNTVNLGYFKQLLLADAYYPEKGWVTIDQVISRLVAHTEFYLWAIIPLVFVLIFDHSRLRRLYILGTMATIAVWPWQDVRFLLPLIPVVVMAVVDRGLGKYLGPVAVVLGISFIPGKLSYPPGWDAYRSATLWCKDNLPADAIISCRKQFWVYVMSGRRTSVYDFGTPEEVLAQMEDRKVTHVIVDNIGYWSTPVHLVPALNSKPDDFGVLWHHPQPETWVLERKQ